MLDLDVGDIVSVSLNNPLFFDAERCEDRGMTLDRTARERLVRALADTMIAHADELTSLDQAIGDGDHGLNMKRGFEDRAGDIPGACGQGAAGHAQGDRHDAGHEGRRRVRADHPTFFMELGESLPEQPARTELVMATDKAIDAVKARGRSDARNKTLLDVLVPVQPFLRRAATPRRSPRRRRRVRPIGPRPCWRSAVVHPSSVRAPSAPWIPECTLGVSLDQQ